VVIRAGSIGLTVGALALLARRLNTAEFGSFAVASLAMFAGAAVGSAGTGRVALRRVTGLLTDGRRAEASALTRSLLPVLRMSAPVGGVLAAVLCRLTTDSSMVPLESCIAVGLTAVGASLLLCISDVFRAWNHRFLADVTNGRNGLVPSLLFLSMVLLDPSDSLPGVLWVQMVAFVVPGALALAWIARHATARPSATVGQWLRDGRTFMMTNLVVLVNGMADVWAARLVLTGDEVGQYAGALRVVSLVVFPHVVAQMVLVRDIAAMLHGRRHVELQAHLRRAASLVLLATAPSLIVLSAPGFVLRSLFGSEFSGAAPVLVILTVAQLVNVATGLCGIVLSMSGHEWMNLASASVGALVTLIAGVLAGWRFGLIGLAVASATGSSLMYLLLFVAARRRVGVWTHARIFPPYRGSLATDPSDSAVSEPPMERPGVMLADGWVETDLRRWVSRADVLPDRSTTLERLGPPRDGGFSFAAVASASRSSPAPSLARRTPVIFVSVIFLLAVSVSWIRLANGVSIALPLLVFSALTVSMSGGWHPSSRVVIPFVLLSTGGLLNTIAHSTPYRSMAAQAVLAGCLLVTQLGASVAWLSARRPVNLLPAVLVLVGGFTALAALGGANIASETRLLLQGGSVQSYLNGVFRPAAQAAARLVGAARDSSNVRHQLTEALILAAGLAIWRGSGRTRSLTIGIASATVVMSLSRSSMLAASVPVAIFVAIRLREMLRRFRLTPASVSAIVVVLGLLPTVGTAIARRLSGADDLSAERRASAVGEAIHEAGRSYLVGLDIPRTDVQSPHNLLLDSLLGGGVVSLVGALMLLMIALRVLLHCIRRAWRATSSEELRWALGCVTVASVPVVRYLTAGDGFLELPLWAGLGLAIGMFDHGHRRGVPHLLAGQQHPSGLTNSTVTARSRGPGVVRSDGIVKRRGESDSLPRIPAQPSGGVR